MRRCWQNSYCVLLLQILTFWPVWSWYVARMGDRSDEPWGVIALATAALFTLRKRGARKLTRLQLYTVVALTSVYLVSFSSTPPLVRALLAVLSIGCTLSACSNRRGLHGGVLGLLVLSLPIIASLQFYAGYPLRLCTAYIAAQLLCLSGHHVVADGTMLLWFGERIAVDAPCAGIHMLWAGLFISFTLAALFDFSARQTWLSYSCASILLFGGNVVRNYILFFLEAGILRLPAGAHSAIGALVFLSVAISIVILNHLIKRKTLPCVVLTGGRQYQ